MSSLFQAGLRGNTLDSNPVGKWYITLSPPHPPVLMQ
jgi:hypothetical protein